jgi:hypothetical protein
MLSACVDIYKAIFSVLLLLSGQYMVFAEFVELGFWSTVAVVSLAIFLIILLCLFVVILLAML